MKVLVIPEDPTNDQHVLKPIVAAIFKDLGRVARVDILQNPRLQSVTQALDPKNLAGIIASYPQSDLFLLLLDRDCEEFRSEKIKAREQEASNMNKVLIGSLALEEVEMWALAVYDGPLPHTWQEMRCECHPKESFFEPLVVQLELQNTVGRGRKRLMSEFTAKEHARLLRLCPEVAELQERIKQVL